MASVSIGLAKFVEDEINKLVAQDYGIDIDNLVANSILSEILASATGADFKTQIIQSIILDKLKTKMKYDLLSGSKQVLTKVAVNGDATLFNKKLEKIAKKRAKEVNYNRLAKRQGNILINQTKQLGAEKANAKFANRMTNIVKNERAYNEDQGRIQSAREVNKYTGKTALKKWVHGMYGTPKEPRDLHVAANGQYADIDGKFSVAGELVDGPGDFSDISQNINCHCGIEIVIR